MGRTLLNLSVILTIVLSMGCQQASGQENNDLTIFLVRHAEKEFPPFDEDPPDPDLNNAGKDRADQLMRMLQSAEITEIYSTDTRRTRQTVEPLAKLMNLDIQTYNGRELNDFAAEMKKKTGRVIVSGHSNTTPELVAALGGDPGEPLNEMTQFDRIYILTYSQGEYVNTVLLKYGANYD